MDNHRANRLTILHTTSNLENVIVYPNPYRLQSAAQDLMFGNLPQQSEILIYSASGQFIRRLEDINAAGGVTWDLRTNAGNLAGSGVYIYLVRLNGEEKRGKFLVVK